MRNEILELEKILEQEIDACNHLEKYIIEKNDCLIKGDIDGLIKTDVELEKYNEAIKKLEQKRQELCPDNPPAHIESLKQDLKNKLINIEKTNLLNSELLKYALKIVESSITSITKALVPESTSYNSRGKMNRDENTGTISSVIHEA